MKKYATKGSHEGEQQQYTQYTFLLYSSRAHTFPDVYFYINNRCPSILQIYKKIYDTYCNNNGRVKSNYFNQPFLKFPWGGSKFSLLKNTYLF